MRLLLYHIRRYRIQGTMSGKQHLEDAGACRLSVRLLPSLQNYPPGNGSDVEKPVPPPAEQRYLMWRTEHIQKPSSTSEERDNPYTSQFHPSRSNTASLASSSHYVPSLHLCRAVFSTCTRADCRNLCNIPFLVSHSCSLPSLTLCFWPVRVKDRSFSSRDGKTHGPERSRP